MQIMRFIPRPRLAAARTRFRVGDSELASSEDSDEKEKNIRERRCSIWNRTGDPTLFRLCSDLTVRFMIVMPMICVTANIRSH
jgi:hypothetical protein